MHKKLLYTFVILAMVFGAFGMMGPGGVQTVQAGWGDNRPGTPTILPYFTQIDLTNYGAGTGDFGGCSTAPAFGAFQAHTLVTQAEMEDYLRVRVSAQGANIEEAGWAVSVRRTTAGFPELGCALVPASGLIDLVVEAPATGDVVITIASHGIFVPTAGPGNLFNTWIVTSEYPSGGMIIDMRADAGDVAARLVEATNQADEGTDIFYASVPFNVTNQVFLDIPAGTYNLGVQDQSADAEFAAYYPDVELTPPGFLAMTPDLDSLIPLEVRVQNEVDVAFNVDNVVLTPNYFGLNSDLEVGPTGVGAEGAGIKTFRINFNPPTYDYKWDIAVIWENNDQVVFLYEKDFNPAAGTLIFWGSQKVSALVELCADAGYDAGGITLNPHSQLEPRDFAFVVAGAVCPVGYEGKWFFLSSNEFGSKPYEVDELFLDENGWTYFYEPLGGTTWDYPPHSLVPYEASDAFVIGDLPFITTPVPNATTQEEYVLPLAAGEVALLRGIYTDQFGNHLYRIVEPTGPSDIFPEYWLTMVNPSPIFYDGVLEPLANDWDIDALIAHWGEEPFEQVIGRYSFIRRIEHGGFFGTIDPGFFYANDEDTDLMDVFEEDITGYNFAISPSDNTMFGHWSWSWVMAMYEYGFTTGLDAVRYGPRDTVTRAQVATFIGRVMTFLDMEPLGLAEEFDDVPAGHWAYDSIMLMRDYGIIDGKGNNMYAPRDPLTRAQMAKIIFNAFRAIEFYQGGWSSQYWDPLHLLQPSYDVFVDVDGASNAWAVPYIETLYDEDVIDGCKVEMTGDSQIRYFCPEEYVHRGQMAKFIMQALQENDVTQGFWPILSPER